MPGITPIPEKEVRIYQNHDRLLKGIPLYIADNISLNLSSNFGPAFNVPSNAFADTIASGLSGAIGAVTGWHPSLSTHNKFFGFQQWQGSEPVSFSMVFTFFQGIAGLHNAKKEVYDPIMTLTKLPLPYEDSGSGILTSPSGNIIDLLVASGAEHVSPAQTDAANNAIPPQARVLGATAARPSNTMDEAVNANAAGFLSIRVGNQIFIPWCIITQVEPSFSKEVDESGYSIHGTATVHIKSAFSASKKLIEYWEKTTLGQGTSWANGRYSGSRFAGNGRD